MDRMRERGKSEEIERERGMKEKEVGDKVDKVIETEKERNNWVDNL